MRKYILCSLVLLVLFACNKQDSFQKHETYKDVIYRIETDDSLTVYLMRAVYTDDVKGNIGKDTLIADSGLYLIAATVLTGVKVELNGFSTISPNFDLKIIGDNNTVLAETDTITHYPPNPAHSDHQYISRISFMP